MVLSAWEDTFLMPADATWWHRTDEDHCGESTWRRVDDSEARCPTCGVEDGAPPPVPDAESRLWLYELPDDHAYHDLKSLLVAVRAPGVLLIEHESRRWLGNFVSRTRFEHRDRWHLCLAFVQAGYLPPASACVLADPSTAWDREAALERTARLFGRGFTDELAQVARAARRSLRFAEKAGHRVPYLEDDSDFGDQAGFLYFVEQSWKRRRRHYLTLARGAGGSLNPIDEILVLFGELDDMRAAREERESETNGSDGSLDEHGRE